MSFTKTNALLQRDISISTIGLDSEVRVAWDRGEGGGIPGRGRGEGRYSQKGGRGGGKPGRGRGEGGEVQPEEAGQCSVHVSTRESDGR